MDKYTERIRDIINKARKKHLLMKNLRLWFQLCSSIDVIEDSDLAIDAYRNNKLGESKDILYLLVYGLLQALFLQQDAVFDLCESLGFSNKKKEYPKLMRIRDIRNAATGHPTKKKEHKSKLTSNHFISRVTLTTSHFELLSHHARGDSTITGINIFELINDQKESLSEILKEVIDKMEKEEKDHKEKFKNEKLVAVFPSTLGYYFGKISESIGKKDFSGFGDSHLDLISEILVKFKDALGNRDMELDAYGSIKDLYECIEYPIDKLKKYFQCIESNKETLFNEKDAHIYLFFIRKKVDILKKIAAEIDEDYSS